MADPLSLLREFVSGGRIEEVALAGDRVDFGGRFSFSKNVATGYKSQQVRACACICVCIRQLHRWPGGMDASRAPCHSPLPARRSHSSPPYQLPICPSTRQPTIKQGKGNFYDLETLLFFAQHLDAKFTEYFKKVRGKGWKGEVEFFEYLHLAHLDYIQTPHSHPTPISCTGRARDRQAGHVCGPQGVLGGGVVI